MEFAAKVHSKPPPQNVTELMDVLKDIVKPQYKDQVKIQLHHQTQLVGKKIEKKIKKAKQQKKATLSRKKYADIGLYSLPTKSMKYDDLLPLHEMWQQYMTEHLGMDDEKFHFPAVDEPAYEAYSKLMVKSDFHGAIVQVIRSKCPSLVGCSGIVAMDTKNTFKLLCKDDKLRTIPKVDSVFQIIINQLELTIFGKHLTIRPAERSVKKIKNFMDPDL